MPNTISVNVSENDTKKIDLNNPNGVHNGDTVNATVHSGSELTIEKLDISMEVTAKDGQAKIEATEGADLTITKATVENGGSIEFKLDYESSITYNVNADSSDALNSTTFDYMGSAEEGQPGNTSVGIVKIVAQESDLDADGLNFSIKNLQIGDKLLVEIVDESGNVIVPNEYQFTSTPDFTTLQLFSKDAQGNIQTLATIQLPNGYEVGEDYKLLPDGTFVVACYLRDTLISTPDGQKAVQDLQPGDQILTASGGTATVKWLGYRKMYASRIPASQAIRAYPIRIAAGALAPKVPTRDLYVSPYHHMYFSGKLIPAMLLVNGQTITQDFSRRSFEYFHVELDRFDIMLAEGAAAESYVDTGNRSMFQNVNVVSLLADFGPPEGRREIEGIEIVRNGPQVQAVRKQLLKRAEALSKAKRVSDPDLRVEINGQEIRPEPAERTEGVMRFVLPAGVQASDVRILSRSSVVRDTTMHARRDLRRVGVGLARITIEDTAGRRDIDLLDARLRGMQAVQDVHGIAMRWTTGKAIIPMAVHAAQGPAVLELHVLRTYSYWTTPAKRAA